MLVIHHRVLELCDYLALHCDQVGLLLHAFQVIVEDCFLSLEAFGFVIGIFNAHLISVVLVLLADLVTIKIILQVVLLFILIMLLLLLPMVMVEVVVIRTLQVFYTHLVHIVRMHVVLVRGDLLLLLLPSRLMNGILVVVVPEVVTNGLLLRFGLLEDRVVVVGGPGHH